MAAALEEDREQTVVTERGKRAKILVMDDEAIVRNVAGELIRALGHEAELAEHGEAATELYRNARQAGRPFDLVILDLTIRGGMGGLETMKGLKEIDPEVRVVVSSGYSDDSAMGGSMQHGFIASLKKPYTIEALRNMLSAVLGDA